MSIEEERAVYGEPWKSGYYKFTIVDKQGNVVKEVRKRFTWQAWCSAQFEVIRACCKDSNIDRGILTPIEKEEVY